MLAAPGGTVDRCSMEGEVQSSAQQLKASAIRAQAGTIAVGMRPDAPDRTACRRHRCRCCLLAVERALLSAFVLQTLQVLFCGEDMHYGYVFTAEALAKDEGVKVRWAVPFGHRGPALLSAASAMHSAGKQSTCRQQRPLLPRLLTHHAGRAV